MNLSSGLAACILVTHMVEIQGFMASIQLGTSQNAERMQLPD